MLLHLQFMLNCPTIFVGSLNIKASREPSPTEGRRPEITYHLEFNLENDKSYPVKENDHKIDVWANEGLVYDDNACGIKNLNP